MARRAHVDISMGIQPAAPTSDALMQEQMASALALQDAASKHPEEPKAVKSTNYVIFKLVNTSRKGAVNVDGIDDVINPETSKLERIRLVTGCDSIWLKDQKNLTDDYVRQNRRSLKFEGKFCRIPEWDTTAIEFARICRSFVESPTYKSRGSKHAFFEWNPARMAEENAKKTRRKMDAMKKAIDAPVDYMRKHAYYLGVQAVDEIGLPKNDEAIRNDYFVKAEQNPEHFLKTYEDPAVNISYMVKKALSEGKIDLGRTQGSAYWAFNGGLIGQIPLGQTPHGYLVNLSLNHTKEGKAFLETLQSISS